MTEITVLKSDHLILKDKVVYTLIIMDYTADLIVESVTSYQTVDDVVIGDGQSDDHSDTEDTTGTVVRR